MGIACQTAQDRRCLHAQLRQSPDGCNNSIVDHDSENGRLQIHTFPACAEWQVCYDNNQLLDLDCVLH